MFWVYSFFFFFFFNDTATTEIYTLSLHDALPIFMIYLFKQPFKLDYLWAGFCLDRKSTRLNSSHITISYAVFCLKKKKKKLVEVWRCCEGVHGGGKKGMLSP